MKTLIAVFCFVLSALAQSGFVVDSPARTATVEVHLSYSLPADDPFVVAGRTDPKQAPAKITWFFGDEKPGVKQRNYTDRPWSASNTITHSYPPGKYAVMVVIVDQKGRLVKEDGIEIEVSVPVKRAIATP